MKKLSLIFVATSLLTNAAHALHHPSPTAIAAAKALSEKKGTITKPTIEPGSATRSVEVEKSTNGEVTVTRTTKGNDGNASRTVEREYDSETKSVVATGTTTVEHKGKTKSNSFERENVKQK